MRFPCGNVLPPGRTYEIMLKKNIRATAESIFVQTVSEKHKNFRIRHRGAIPPKLREIVVEIFVKNQCESKFMSEKVPLLLARYALSYFQEGPCIEYFISRRFCTETISSDLVFSYSPAKKDLHVSRFYPELYHECNSKYLSAACFYIIVQHCASIYRLDEFCRISLETIPSIGDNFYGKLKDFNFHVHKRCLGNVVELTSKLVRAPVDTSMIGEHIFGKGEIPFLK